MSTRRSRHLSEDEVALVQVLLASQVPKTVKSGLQLLCAHYEQGRRLLDPYPIRLSLHSHLWSDQILARRWSIKALGLIGKSEDAGRILDRLGSEKDVEAQTWGIAALLNIVRDRDLVALCRDAGLDYNKHLILAARLYAPKQWLQEYSKPVTISLNDDEVTLKWGIFLTGYGRAPVDLFDPKHANSVFLGKLNQHDAPEVAEYSVWALWERPEFDIKHLQLTTSQVLEKPQNARKWIYRLHTKRGAGSELSADTFNLFRSDRLVTAREGLALGVLDHCPPNLDGDILEWFDCETSSEIKDILLCVMAANSDRDVDFADAVERTFESSDVAGGLRRRLLVASAGTRLYRRLKILEFRDAFSKQGLFEFARPLFTINGDVLMSGIKVGGNLNALNVSAGDMIGSANASVQQMKVGRQVDGEVLTRILDYLNQDVVPVENRKEIAAAVQSYATAPSAESKGGLTSALARTASAIGMVSGLAEIIEIASRLVS